MKTGQKQLQNIAKSDPAKTNNSNAHSCALILLFIVVKSEVVLKSVFLSITTTIIIIIINFKFGYTHKHNCKIVQECSVSTV